MKKYIFPAIVALLLITVYFILNPSDSALFPKCPFLALTGLKCPGCGSQRAIHSLLNLDIVSALRYNGLLVISIPVIILYLYAEINRNRKAGLYSHMHSQFIIWCIFVIVITWWILRNILDI